MFAFYKDALSMNVYIYVMNTFSILKTKILKINEFKKQIGLLSESTIYTVTVQNLLFFCCVLGRHYSPLDGFSKQLKKFCLYLVIKNFKE